jgi:hypothetical protein
VQADFDRSGRRTNTLNGWIIADRVDRELPFFNPFVNHSWRHPIFAGEFVSLEIGRGARFCILATA